MSLVAGFDDAVADYADETYNPDYAAYYFFKEHHESEAQKRMNDLTRLRVHVEDVLRHNVADNYRIFMQATREIQRMSAEIAELKQAVQDTSAVVSNLSAMKLSTQIQFSSLDSPVSATDDPFASMRESMLHKLPAWLKAAPAELDKLILEQQYAKAVRLIAKCRGYIASVADAVDLGPGAEAIVRKMDMHAATVCNKLQRSLTKVPASQIWGHVEQQRRLRLLISLGKADVAAEAFAKIQMQTIRRSMRFLEASGDPLSSAQMHCHVFFQVLEKACRAYINLFDERKHSSHSRASYIQRTPSAVNAQLLVWVTKELRAFVDMIARQLRLGAAEASAHLLEACRPPKHWSAGKAAHPEGDAALTAVTTPSATLSQPLRAQPQSASTGTAEVDTADSDPSSPKPMVRRRSLNKLVMKLKNSDSFTAHQSSAAAEGTPVPGINPVLSRSSSSQAGRDSTPQKDKFSSTSGAGPFQFVAHCCMAAFYHCQKVDALGLSVSSLYGWALVPHLCRLLDQHVDRIADELAVQVKQDSWSPMPSGRVELLTPPNCTADLYVARQSTTLDNFVSSSFDWLVAVTTKTVEDCWLFLYPELLIGLKGHDSTAMLSDLSIARYTRDDFAAFEPRVVECIVELLRKYLEELEAVQHSTFSKEQRACARDNLLAFETKLLPSVQEVVHDSFFMGDFAFDQAISKLRDQASQLRSSHYQ